MSSNIQSLLPFPVYSSDPHTYAPACHSQTGSPDICIICDKAKLTKQGCTGAPDWIIEILSPGNTNREMRDKFELYQEAGVREYWIIEPQNRHVLRYALREGIYIGLPPKTEEDPIVSDCFADFAIEGKVLFGSKE